MDVRQKPEMEGDRLLTNIEAARILGMAPGTLARSRVTGKPATPGFIKLGGKAVRYRMSTVQAWINAQTEHKNTSEAA
jgi:predicted DNA-binding transcriptional regulator AlpA